MSFRRGNGKAIDQQTAESSLTDPSTSKISRSDIRNLLCILAGALLLRMLYFSGVGGLDDIDYFRYARQVLDGTFTTTAAQDGSFPFRFRLGLILPTAVMFRLFGVSEFVAAVFPLLNSLGLVVVCWWGGLRISRGTGMLAATLMATFPLAISHATMLMPDSFAAFWTACSILGWLHVRDRKRDGQISDKSATIGFFVAGLALGLGYFFRLEVGLFVLFYLGFAALHRNEWRACGLAIVGAAVPVIIENLVYFGLHGEILYRLRSISGGFSGINDGLHDFVAQKKSPLHFLKIMYLKPTELGLHWALIAPSALICLKIARPRRQAFLIWFWPVMLYLAFGTWSLSSYVPTTKEPRYLFSVSIPGIILAASLIDQLMAARPQRRLLLNACVFAAICGSLTLLNVSHIYATENAASSRIAAEFLRREVVAGNSADQEPVWCDHYCLLMLSAFNPDGNYRMLHRHDISFNANETLVDVDDITTGYVVIDNFLLDKYRRDAGFEPPEYLLNPPKEWRLIFEAPHPTNDFRFVVMRLFASMLGGAESGPAKSLRSDPIRIYAVSSNSLLTAN